MTWNRYERQTATVWRMVLIFSVENGKEWKREQTNSCCILLLALYFQFNLCFHFHISDLHFSSFLCAPVHQQNSTFTACFPLSLRTFSFILSVPYASLRQNGKQKWKNPQLKQQRKNKREWFRVVFNLPRKPNERVQMPTETNEKENGDNRKTQDESKLATQRRRRQQK